MSPLNMPGGAAPTTTEIQLAEISPEPGPFCMSYGYDPTAIERSLAAVGLINSPLVLTTRPGSYEVVAGYRRIEASRRLGHRAIICRVLPPASAGRLELLLLNLYDNLTVRSLNPVEKAMVLERLRQHLPEEEVRSRYMPLLDLAANAATLDFYLELFAKLEPPMLEALACGRLGLPASKALLELEVAERRVAFDLLNKLNLSINNQVQLIDIINDISIANHCAISDVTTWEDLRASMEAPALNGPQRGKACLAVLRRRRFPRLAAAEKAFHSSLARLDLPRGARIQAPPFFEDAGLRLELAFHDGADLRRRLRELLDLEKLEDLRPAWSEESKGSAGESP